MQSRYNQPVWVYAHPSMEALAEAVVDRCSAYSAHVSVQNSHVKGTSSNPSATVGAALPLKTFTRQFSQLERRHVQLKKTIQWGKFNDGFPNLFIEDVRLMAGKDVIFIGSFHSPDVIFEQLSIIYAIPRYLAKSFTLLLPYFPTGTMERVDTEGQIATAKTLATLLSSTPLTARGPAQILVFDIHALQERFYFSESIIPRLETAVPLLQNELFSLKTGTDAESLPLAVAFPDDGAFKRFHHMFVNTPSIICNKVRRGKERFVKVKDGEPNGCHVIIIDDLIQTGGTIVECIKALRSAGAKRISCFVTHAVFPNDSWKKFTTADSDVDIAAFWITDSIPHAREISRHPPFKLLTLADIIVDVLWGYDLVRPNELRLTGVRLAGFGKLMGVYLTCKRTNTSTNGYLFCFMLNVFDERFGFLQCF